ncbi:hypothetical protein ANN_20084 [Periplaneta americana]|uniref:Uncharacterized protein n=1 Tax=Periplaneta americana TaxID=6978 RepID=A0ABQ8SBN5_PERAM|nr:hypothetical protein ANN_20084 [Periplaneta americana]
MDQTSSGSEGLPPPNGIKRDSIDEVTTALKSVSLDDDGIFKELQFLQCPFNWVNEDRNVKDTSDTIINRTLEKLEEIEEEGAFPWRTFTLTLLICYEYYCKNSYAESLEKQKICEKLSHQKIQKDHMKISFNQQKMPFVMSFPLANVTYILQQDAKVKLNSCFKVCKNLQTWIAHSAVEHIEKALQLDPQQGEWHFLHGKCLGRIRRIDNYNEIPTKTELKALEKAVEITRNPSYIIFLAQAYREAAFRVFSMQRNTLNDDLKASLDRMNQRSYQLYKDALNLRGDCSHINIRCAQGFFKLPNPFRDIKLAKECCEKALILAPNNAMANHVSGQLQERYCNDIERAKKHYQAAGDQGAYGAFMDLYRLNYSEDKSYNPISDFELLLKRYKEKPRQEETVCQMGSYYCFIRNDITTAYRRYWKQVMDDNPDSEKLKNKVLRKIFGAKRDDVTGEWRKLHNTELHPLYSSPDIIRNIKSRRLRWAGHIACMGESRNAYRVLVGRPEGKRPLGRPRRRWEDNIKMNLREVEYDDREWINLAQDRDQWHAYVRAAMNLRTHKCTFLHMRTPVNIYELLYDEARLALNNDEISAEDHKTFQEIKLHIEAKKPEMSQTEPLSRLKMVWEESTYASNSRRQRGRGRGRGGNRGRGRGRGRGDSYNTGNRSDSREGGRGGRGNYRGNSRGAYNRYNSRDSSTESRNSNKGGCHPRPSSRESSVNSRDGHQSRERNFGRSWPQRDSSNESRSSQDKNWRSGPRDFGPPAGERPNASRDSSCSSVDSRNGYRAYNDRRRTDSTSSVGSYTGQRKRTDSTSSAGSDVRRDWRDGCLGGGGDRSRKNSDIDNNWRTGRASNQDERRPNNNRGSWRGRNERGNSDGKREDRQHNASQGSRDRDSSSQQQQNQGMGDSFRAPQQRQRGGFRKRGDDFKLSWRNND